MFPFDTYFLDVLRPILDSSPVLFMFINVYFFSTTKQVCGILFSMVFLLTCTKITKPELKSSLFATAIGIAVLFGSLEIGTLLYAVCHILVTSNDFIYACWFLFSSKWDLHVGNKHISCFTAAP